MGVVRTDSQVPTTPMILRVTTVTRKQTSILRVAATDQLVEKDAIDQLVEEDVTDHLVKKDVERSTIS
jgi:hypothetical protein